MDISTANTLASGLVGLIVPAFVQAFKKYIPSGYIGLVSRSTHPVRHHRHRRNRRIRRHLHVGHRTCRRGGCRSDCVHARQSGV